MNFLLVYITQILPNSKCKLTKVSLTKFGMIQKLLKLSTTIGNYEIVAELLKGIFPHNILQCPQLLCRSIISFKSFLETEFFSQKDKSKIWFFFEKCVQCLKSRCEASSGFQSWMDLSLKVYQWISNKTLVEFGSKKTLGP